VALSAEELQQLRDAGFENFYKDKEKLWRELASEAYRYTTGYVKPTGEAVRVDDVVKALVPALEVNQAFTDRLAEKRLTQKYWRTRFADLILDKLWTELSGGDKDARLG